MKRRWHSSLLRRFALSFSLLLLLLAGFGAFASCKITATVSMHADRNSLALLNQFMRGVEYRLREVDSITSRLIAMPQTIRLRTSQGGPELPYLKYEALESMKPYALYNSLGTEYVLYFRKSDTVVTTRSAYDVREFHALNGYEGMSFDAFREQMLGMRTGGAVLPVRRVKGSDVQLSGTLRYTHPVLTYIKSMPVSPGAAVDGAALAQISLDGLLTLLSDRGATAQRTVYALDKAGTAIFRLPEGEPALPADIRLQGPTGVQAMTLDGRRMSVIHTVSPYNGWTYVAVTPYALVQSEVATARRLMVGVTAVSFVAGLVILLGISYLNAKPILELANVLRLFWGGAGDGMDELEFLRSSISRAAGEVIAARSERDKARDAQCESMLRRLLQGVFDERELLREADHIHLDLRCSRYVLLLIRSSDAAAVNGLIRYELSRQNDPAACLGMAIDAHTSCLMICSQADSDDACMAQTERTMAAMRDVLMGHDAAFAAGRPFMTLRKASNAYDEARDALALLPPSQGQAIHWSEAEGPGDGLPYFPLAQEQRLIACAISGNQDMAERIIGQLHRRNTEPVLVNGNDFQLLKHEIIAAIYKMGAPDAADTEVRIERAAHEASSRREELDSVFRLLREAVMALCAQNHAHRGGRARDMREKMLQYVHERFQDSSLCLNALADALGITETYASQLFAELTGENFLRYVERLRIAEAEHLLRQGGRTVAAVADGVGYTSAATFRRAFKRATGMSPGEFAQKS